tara:strand:+ start:536 stop:1729 length:1194 start_codon:yes stop_codon:yes gene_type:complete
MSQFYGQNQFGQYGGMPFNPYGGGFGIMPTSSYGGGFGGGLMSPFPPRFPSPYRNPYYMEPVYGGGMGQVRPTNIPFRDPGYGSPMLTQNLIQSLGGPQTSFRNTYRPYSTLGMLDRFRGGNMGSPFPMPYPQMPSPGGKGGRMPMPGMPGKGGRMPGMPGKGGQMPPDQGMPPTGGEMPPAGGEVPPAGGTPPADTPTTQTPYEARLAEIMADQGKTREQAIANQDYAIGQGFDTDGDGAVTNAEYAAELARRNATPPSPGDDMVMDEPSILETPTPETQPPVRDPIPEAEPPPPDPASDVLAGGNPYLDNLTPEQRAAIDQIRQGGFSPFGAAQSLPRAFLSPRNAEMETYNLDPNLGRQVDYGYANSSNPFLGGIGSLYGVGGGMIPNLSGIRF